jgi:hypothetical protein
MRSNDARVRRPALYEYRCKLCGTAEPAKTREEARILRAVHRDEFHGYDAIVEVGRMRFVDLPRKQKIATVAVAVALLVAGLVRFC